MLNTSEHYKLNAKTAIIFHGMSQFRTTQRSLLFSTFFLFHFMHKLHFISLYISRPIHFVSYSTLFLPVKPGIPLLPRSPIFAKDFRVFFFNEKSIKTSRRIHTNLFARVDQLVLVLLWILLIQGLLHFQ